MIEGIVKYTSIVFTIFFVLYSFKRPVSFFFAIIIIDSNFLATIDLYAIPVFSMSGFTLYFNDLTKIVLAYLVFRKFKYLKGLEYNKLLLIVISFFLIPIFIKSIFQISAVSFNEFKNLLRYNVYFLFPYYFIIYFKEKDKKFFEYSFILIVIMTISIFLLEYFDMFSKVRWSQLEGLITYVKPDVTASFKRVTIIAGALVSIAAPIFTIKFIKSKNYFFLVLLVSLFIVFFLSSFRTHLIIFLLGVVLSIFLYLKESKVKALLLGIIVVFILFMLSFSILQDYIFQGALERATSSFTDLSQNEGTGYSRVIKTEYVWSILITNPVLLLFGASFTPLSQVLSEYISADLGLISTLSIYGLFTVIALIYFYIKLLKSGFSNYRGNNLLNKEFSIPFIAYMVACIPGLLFNIELMAFFTSTGLIFYGITKAQENWINNEFNLIK